ncbi:MAG: ABC transporter ATP-binding protein [Firmicutes bacterium]|jgi:ABC-type lipoprotein export system ATPase subunit|nr:ABC transporter ATP-binding protein [Bacillota bacterium]
MIELISITKVYGQEPNTVTALDRVTLKLNPNELTAVMGPSGSGKTTLLNIIGCLDSATAGEYHLDGENVAGLDLKAKARLRNEMFGFVFQAFNLLPDKTVLDNVMIPSRYSRRPRKEWKPKAMAVLEQMGIADLALRYPDQLSGGQQQRVAIARALVNDPKVILADEPTGNLDSATGREIVDVLKTLADKQGKAVVVVTHDGMVASQAHRLLQMMDGRIIDDSMLDSSSVVFSHPNF